MAKSAFLPYLWRTSAVFLIALPILLVLGIIGFQSCEWGTLSGLCLGVSLVHGIGWVKAYRSTGLIAAQPSVDTVHLAFDDDGLSVSNELITSTIKWRAFGALVTTKSTIFLIRHGVSNPMPIPISALSDEAMAELLRQIRQAGGKVC